MAGPSTATALDLLRMTDGLVVHQALFAAAKLGISDLLTDGERSTDELASTLRVNRDALYRTLRNSLLCRPPPQLIQRVQSRS